MAWGSLGGGNGQFNGPTGVAVDAAGDVFVADGFNNRIQKFDNHGTFLTAWGSSGSGNGQFNTPGFVAVDAAGNVFVSDNANARVQKFDNSGAFLTAWGTFGTGNGQFRSPTGVATDAAGDVFVVDFLNDNVQKFDNSGTFLTGWGSDGYGNGQFKGPNGIAVDAVGNVIVADTYDNRIQKFDNAGTFLTWWGTNYADAMVALDAVGNVFASNLNNNGIIQEFDPSGTLLTTWGASGSGNGQFNNPTGIAVDGSGNVFVADTGNDRIQKFGCGGTAGSCGNGQIDSGESCDDGNPTSGDGCSGDTCQTEQGWTCPTPGQPCTPANPYGRYPVTWTDSSGCQACVPCMGPNQPGGCDPHCASQCPDLSSGAGSGSCHIDITRGAGANQVQAEASGCGLDFVTPLTHDSTTRTWTGRPITAVDTASHGAGELRGDSIDGQVTLNDDTATIAGTFTIVTPPVGELLPRCASGPACVHTVFNGTLNVSCGNGFPDDGEDCDDGNTASGDGCSGNTCQIEPGWTCPTAGQPCTFLANATSPDIKLAEPLTGISRLYCVVQLLGIISDPILVPFIPSACELLADSENNDRLKSRMSAAQWDDFTAKKEYRGYLHMPAVGLNCVGSKINGYHPADGFEFSGGYTKSGPLFPPAEELIDPGFNQPTPKYRLSSDQTLLNVRYRMASRIATKERQGAYLTLGFDAPYVWTVLEENITCTGTSIRIRQSVLPTLTAYIDGKRVAKQKAKDLGVFTASGGTSLSQPGVGKLAPYCKPSVLKTIGKATPIAEPPCQADYAPETCDICPDDAPCPPACTQCDAGSICVWSDNPSDDPQSPSGSFNEWPATDTYEPDYTNIPYGTFVSGSASFTNDSISYVWNRTDKVLVLYHNDHHRGPYICLKPGEAWENQVYLPKAGPAGCFNDLFSSHQLVDLNAPTIPGDHETDRDGGWDHCGVCP